MKKRMAAMLCVAFLCVLSAGCGKKADILLTNAEMSVSDEPELSAPGEEEAETAPSVFAYICGAVKNPGVYELEPGSRIYQLVELAGGLKKKADAQSVNLAEPLTDGEMVWVPEISASKKTEREETPAGLSADGRVNINTATKEQLMTLSGIGESKAERIIAFRENSGGFQSAEDIMQVEGIKEGTFEKLRDSITVQ